jgi:transposase InsO family protein
LGVSGFGDRLLHPRIVGWDLSLRCRTEEALAALNRAVLEVLPYGSRGMGLTLTTDNGTQFTSARYVETLNRLGITHRRTAYNHPEGNSYIERFHRGLKEEEVWLNDYQTFDQAQQSIARWIEEYNHAPSASRTPRTNPARRPCPVRPYPYFKHGPMCLVCRGALQGRAVDHFGVGVNS